MPFAKEDHLNQNPVSGGLEISPSQYKDGLRALVMGRHISIVKGFEIVDSLEPGKETKPVSVQDAKDEAQQELSLRYSNAERLGVVVLGVGRIQTDPKTRARFHMLLTLFQIQPGMEPVDWEIGPNVWVKLNEADVKKILILMEARSQQNRANKRAIFETLEQKLTVAEVESVDIAVGWEKSEVK